MEGLISAVHKFELETFDPEACRKNALRFSRDRFEDEMLVGIRNALLRA